jgi:hypothetical protein
MTGSAEKTTTWTAAAVATAAAAGTTTTPATDDDIEYELSGVEIIEPDPEISGLPDYQEYNFPPLHYRRVSKPFREPMRRENPDIRQHGPDKLISDIVLGGSYRKVHYTPHFDERVAIFEQLLFPYQGLPKKSRFRSANGLMLFLGIQLHSFTQISNPAQVFISEKQMDESRLVGRFQFFRDRIELTELDDDMTADSPKFERPPPLPFITS